MHARTRRYLIALATVAATLGFAAPSSAEILSLGVSPSAVSVDQAGVGDGTVRYSFFYNAPSALRGFDVPSQTIFMRLSAWGVNSAGAARFWALDGNSVGGRIDRTITLAELQRLAGGRRLQRRTVYVLTAWTGWHDAIRWNIPRVALFRTS